jgi:hypothetical protein
MHCARPRSTSTVIFVDAEATGECGATVRSAAHQCGCGAWAEKVAGATTYNRTQHGKLVSSTCPAVRAVEVNALRPTCSQTLALLGHAPILAKTAC